MENYFWVDCLRTAPHCYNMESGEAHLCNRHAIGRVCFFVSDLPYFIKKVIVKEVIRVDFSKEV